MTGQKTHLDAAFLASQKSRLVRLRDELSNDLSAVANDESNETRANDESSDRGDDAQRLAALELDGLLEKRHTTRIESIDRAIQKIENGSYGVSIVSGRLISRARLEAVPEALWDVDEQPK
jgi:DnaK suppressor protein